MILTIHRISGPVLPSAHGSMRLFLYQRSIRSPYVLSSKERICRGLGYNRAKKLGVSKTVFIQIGVTSPLSHIKNSFFNFKSQALRTLRSAILLCIVLTALRNYNMDHE